MRRHKSSPETVEDGAVEKRESTTNKTMRFLGRSATKLAVFGTLGLFSGAALSAVVPTEVPYGLGTASATTSFDGRATIVGGLIGSFRKPIDGPSIGPIDIGVTLRPNEVPMDLSPEPATPIDNLSIEQVVEQIKGLEIQKYDKFANVSRDERGEITDQLRTHALVLGLCIGATALCLYEMLGENGRAAIKKSARKPGFYILLPIAAYSISMVIPQPSDHDWRPTGPAYNGTPFEDVEVSGELPDKFLNRLGSELIDYDKRTGGLLFGVLGDENG